MQLNGGWSFISPAPVSDAKPSRSLANIAGIVAAATIISKLFGLFRQQAIGAAFAVGPVADAYSFAYIIPGFLLILLGGINGPFHSAIVSVVTKRPREEDCPPGGIYQYPGRADFAQPVGVSVPIGRTHHRPDCPGLISNRPRSA